MRAPQQQTFTVASQRQLAPQVFELRLAGDCSAITAPGQFVNIAVPGFYLRRPISVCDVRRGGEGEADELVLIYKVVGEGTRALAQYAQAARPGDTLELLTGLGNGFLLPRGDAVAVLPLLLVGGGVGVPPLYWLAREARAAGHGVTVVLGFNTASEVFYEQEFAQLGCEVRVSTADGSAGVRGFAPAAMPAPGEYRYLYSCGPIPMLHAVAEASGQTPGELSFEERMGCGFGACMGCSHHVRLPDGSAGYKRICTEGPVLSKEEVLWEAN